MVVFGGSMKCVSRITIDGVAVAACFISSLATASDASVAPQGGAVITVAYASPIVSAAAPREGSGSTASLDRVSASGIASHERAGSKVGIRAADHSLRTADFKTRIDKCSWGTGTGKICSLHAHHVGNRSGPRLLLVTATTSVSSEPFKLSHRIDAINNDAASRTITAASAMGILGIASASNSPIETDKVDSRSVGRAIPLLESEAEERAAAFRAPSEPTGRENPESSAAGRSGTAPSEPSGFAMLLACLGVAGFMVLRRLS